MILTRRAIAHINEYYRLADEADRAYLEQRTEDEVVLRQKAWIARNRVTSAELAAYATADIQPPHIAGRRDPDAQVALYYSTVARRPNRAAPAISPEGGQ